MRSPASLPEVKTLPLPALSAQKEERKDQTSFQESRAIIVTSK
jgi:hypothetical protein